VPPFRLRQTILKPVVNFIGAVPILIVAARFQQFFNPNVHFFFMRGTSTAVTAYGKTSNYKSGLQRPRPSILVVLGVNVD
jgi:hypothetical protein